jgi:aspartyl-tRNA(Asn)/glutamyl-tRNA(Gln) amidotransferase subunit A
VSGGADILDLGVAGLAAAIAAGEVSSVEATSAVLDALERKAPALNALARLRPEQALAAARAADEARARGELLGPLHGVPLAHKDMFDRAGEPSEYGSLLFRGHRAEATAAVVERLDAAGAVDVGRLNMVEFALGITGHNAHTGHPRNAWDPRRITGGSTSGGATSVAARLVPGTLGSDTGGSIRVPASLCGLVGIKPTYGRVSRRGCMPLSFSLDHVGPLARSAEDCALMLGAIAGHDPGDPTTSRRPVPDYRAGLGRGLAGVRIARAEEGVGLEVDAEVARIVDDALGVFLDLGASAVVAPVPDFAPLNALRRVVMLAECAALHHGRVRDRGDAFVPQTTGRMMPGFALSATDYVQALAARGPMLERFCAAVFGGADILAMPTSPVRTPFIEDTDTGGDARFTSLANALGGLVGPFNYLGLPALSLPVGHDMDGMPVGLQLVGRPFAEGLLLRAAHAYERETGTAASRRPPPLPG